MLKYKYTHLNLDKDRFEIFLDSKIKIKSERMKICI